jgi:anti-sigma B factor antagonist
MAELERDRSTVDSHGIRPPDAYAIRAGSAPGGMVVLTLEGEFDLAAVPAVRAQFEAAAGQAARGVVVDMEQVTFVDSSALRELLRADAALRAGGGALLLAAIPATVVRLLELTRTHDVLTAAPSVELALTRLAEQP